MTNLKLKFKRIEACLSQSELAEKVGVSNQTISEYERGNVKPSYDNMVKIAQILNAKVGQLFFNED
jgi:DNA-binding XRE family transcriptional regulator